MDNKESFILLHKTQRFHYSDQCNGVILGPLWQVLFFTVFCCHVGQGLLLCMPPWNNCIFLIN